MTKHRLRLTIAACVLAVASAGIAVAAQTGPPPRSTPAPTPPPPPQRYEQPKPPPPPAVEELIEQRMEDRYRQHGLRIFRDFTLPRGESTWEVFSVLADVRIEGTVRRDVAVTMGSATITSTAIIEGSLIVVGGSATVEPGAVVRRDLVVVGGTLQAPHDFVPGGEEVTVGTPAIGESLRALSPWLTRGLLLGRLIVPDLSWIWTIVVINFLFGLILNQMFARQVGACADTLGRRPGGSFLVGLLVILLAGPALAIIAITVIGLPFAIVALIAASVIGKLGVTRAIGRGIVDESNSSDRSQALRSYVIGAAAVTLSYMVPVLGLLVWALIGVFGLGTATMTFLASIRRERPAAAPPPPAVEPAVAAPSPAPAAVPPSAFIEPEPARGVEYAAPAPPVVVAPIAPAPEPPLVSAPEAVVPPSSAPVAASGLAAYPRATFLDRLAAFALDAILVAIASNVLDFRYFYFGPGGPPFLAWLFVYHIAFWAWKGTTLGGIICNIRMVRTTGESPRFVDALVRGLSAIFSVAALGIGCFWMLNDAERQMWHDKIAGTVVVKVPRELVLA